MKQYKLLLSILLILMVFGTTIALSAPSQNIVSGTAYKLPMPPMNMYVTKYPVFYWWGGSVAAYEYLPINVNVKDSRMRNLNGVSVKLIVYRSSESEGEIYNQTIKTDNNGNANFVLFCSYCYGGNNLVNATIYATRSNGDQVWAYVYNLESLP